MNKLIAVIILVPLALIAAAVLGVGALIYQARQAPKPNAPYVALGSSYAAGIGLGPRPPGSPVLCRRGSGGYPQQVARLAGLQLMDMSCSGATIVNVLKGGQFFMAPQVSAIGPDTKLVTLTAGGNDVGYIGDLIMLSIQQRGGIGASILGHLWKGPKPAPERDFGALRENMIAVLQEIRRRAPQAHVVVVTYPTVLPPAGTCARLGVSDRDVATMRGVADQLARVTRDAAQAGGATVVDMAVVSAGHDACSAEPWTNGSAPEHGEPFHPTSAGAAATAQQIMLVINQGP